MKSFTLLLLALVAGLIVGCTDQSSIIGPAATPVVSQAAPVPPPLNQGIWKLDKMVYSVESATTYHIWGEIQWYLNQIDGEYTFTTDVKAEVTAVTERGGSVTVGEAEVHKGEVSKSGNTQIVTEFATDGLLPGSRLRIEYSIGERVRLAEVGMSFRQWESRKTQLPK